MAKDVWICTGCGLEGRDCTCEGEMGPAGVSIWPELAHYNSKAGQEAIRARVKRLEEQH